MNRLSALSLSNPVVLPHFSVSLSHIKLPDIKRFVSPTRETDTHALVMESFWHGFGYLFLYFFVLPVLVADTILFLIS